MKTIVTFKQHLLKSALIIFVSALSIVANAGTTPASTTPATPSSFTATVNTNNTNRIDLKWSTETETNLSHFIVERSTDGTTFSNAALVFAYGNTSAKSDYAFADNISKVQTGTVYYRISSIANDGANQASDIRIIRIGK